MPFDGPEAQKPIKTALTKDALGYPIHSSVLTALDKAADILEKAGYIVEQVNPPHLREISRVWMRQTFGEMDLMLGSAIRAKGSGTINQIMDAYHAMHGISEPAEFIDKLADRSRLLRDWLMFLEDYPLILTPFLMRPLYGLNEDAESAEKVQDIFAASQYSYSINYLGLPAALIPVNMQDGLPVSVQIVGQRFREDMCLDAIQTIEDSVGVMANQYYAREGLI